MGGGRIPLSSGRQCSDRFGLARENLSRVEVDGYSVVTEGSFDGDLPVEDIVEDLLA